MKDNWVFRPPVDQSMVQNLQKELNISAIYAEILAQRGISDKEEYESQIKLKNFAPYNPFLLNNLDRACQRINQAVENGEKILIYGDYDADGITSTGVLYETLLNIGADVSYYIPDRIIDGYGPNIDTYKREIADDIRLLITVDNGVNGTDAFSWARERNLDVIVCDHHEIPPQISPDIFCLIHPQAPGSHYPNQFLSGVGVAYKVACALLGGEQEEMLDLVAIGTMADVVELTPENRYFVLAGLEVIKGRERLGIDEILKNASVETESIDDSTIGYQIAPRLNSAGRMAKAGFVVDLLTTFDEETAINSAKELEEFNKNRKQLTQEFFEEAVKQVEGTKDKIIVVASSRWSEGVIGIIAAKLAETFGKPAIVFHLDDETGIAKGSARTIGEVNIYDLIFPFKDLLLSFGGHKGAAGLSIEAKDLVKFHDGLQKVHLSVEDLKNQLTIDVETELSNLTMDLYQELNQLRPYGNGNREPVFSIKNFSTSNVHRIGENGNHIRLVVEQNKDRFNAIGFQSGYSFDYFLSKNVEKIAFNLTLNNWNNLVQLQLRIIDFKLNKPLIKDRRMRKIKVNELEEKGYPIVFFSEKHAENFKKKYPQLKSRVYLSYDQTSSLTKVVLFDQPLNEKELSNFFKKNIQLNSVEILFLDSINLAIGGFPSLSEFKNCYKYIYQKKKLPLDKGLVDLGLSSEKTKIVLNVFFDLKFVTIKTCFLLINENAEFHSLEESSVYQFYRQKYEFQREFMLCSTDELQDKIKAYYAESREI